MKPGRFERILKWYPTRWRARYGEELVALMNDTYGDEKLPLSTRIDIVRAGTAEHLQEVGLGSGGTSREKVRSGSLLVLCGWALFVIAGSAFAKMTEHWIVSTPQRTRQIAIRAYDVIQPAASVGLVLVVVAVAIALPTASRFLRGGGWSEVRRPVSRALIISTTTALLTVGMILWDHEVGMAPYGGNWATHLIGSVWALMVVATIGACTLAGAVVAHHLRFSGPILLVEGLLAMLLTLVMVPIIGGALLWSISIADDAPWLLTGSGSGLFGVPGPPAEIVTGLLMLAGLTLGVGGAVRIGRSIRADLSESATSAN